MAAEVREAEPKEVRESSGEDLLELLKGVELRLQTVEAPRLELLHDYSIIILL